MLDSKDLYSLTNSSLNDMIRRKVSDFRLQYGAYVLRGRGVFFTVFVDSRRLRRCIAGVGALAKSLNLLFIHIITRCL